MIRKITNSKPFRKVYYNVKLGTQDILIQKGVKAKVVKTWAKYDEYQLDIAAYKLLRDVQKGDYVIDAGAYQGYFSIYASKKAGSKGKVFAFEPVHWNVKTIKKNLKLNNIKNVAVIEKGLFDKETTLFFDAKGGSSHVSETGGTKLKVTTIDKFLEKNKIPIKKIKFIKMDIEGSEIEALPGAENLIKKGNTFWVIASYHMVKGKETAGYVEQYFKKHGYKVKTDDSIHMKNTYAWK